tara:strand:+ start:6926 stop:7393 length:468 start_codon:yes stop_codon:yes gene_type:complete
MPDTVTNQDDASSHDYLSMHIAGHSFGIPVLQILDVLRAERITRIPLAPKEIAGSLNLRGRIVTAIDVRKRLGLPERDCNQSVMNVVVEHHNELFSLMIDTVGDVLNIPDKSIEKPPKTLDSLWLEVSVGIIQQDEGLLIIIDIARLLDCIGAEI